MQFGEVSQKALLGFSTIVKYHLHIEASPETSYTHKDLGKGQYCWFQSIWWNRQWFPGISPCWCQNVGAAKWTPWARGKHHPHNLVGKVSPYCQINHPNHTYIPSQTGLTSFFLWRATSPCIPPANLSLLSSWNSCNWAQVTLGSWSCFHTIHF